MSHGLLPGRRALLAAGLAVTVTAGTVAVTMEAGAAAGCRVGYVVTNHWPGGFGADVQISNLGDPLNGWRLTWTFGAGQVITQMWGGVPAQDGSRVSVTDAGYNAAIPTGGSAGFGFNASWNNVSNPVPPSFSLNDVACTGAVGTPTPPRTTPPTSPPGIPPPSYPDPGLVTGSTGVHDPSVVRAANGTYVLVSTGNDLAVKTSTDRIAWRDAGVVWPGGAPWTTTYTAGSRNLWAPDISFRNGQFYLYYSASTFGSQRSAIFLATSPTGAAGSWTHRGLVIESSGGVNYNAIDPNLIVDAAGQWWLSFGSFWSGIKLIRLDPATGLRSTVDTAIRSLSQRNTAGGAVEAPFVYRHGGFHYLFVSFDLCCRGAQSTYRVMVGRSTAVTGPYVDRNGVAMTAGGGTQVLAGHGSIHGPGHQAVIGDVDSDILVYHYYTDSGASRLGINLIGWDAAGWPFVH
jgi:arabinan endo-1,5-alpha-L-arabinosidase